MATSLKQLLASLQVLRQRVEQSPGSGGSGEPSQLYFQTKEVTPTKSEQNIRADAGYDAIELVKVKPIPDEFVEMDETEIWKFTLDNGSTVDKTAYKAEVGTLNVDKNGTYEADFSIDGYNKVVVNVPTDNPYEPKLESLDVTENGTHIPDNGIDGYNKVTVNVPEPKLESLDVTENGTYIPDNGIDGYNKVTVNVPEPVTEPLRVTKNGSYTPDYGVDGYSSVTVNVPFNEPITGILEVNSNGVYNATEDIDGYNKVVVNVPTDNPYEPVTEPLDVTENGTYIPNTGVDGYSSVTVNVPILNTKASATEHDIAIAKTAWVNGEKIVGEVPVYKEGVPYSPTGEIIITYYMDVNTGAYFEIKVNDVEEQALLRSGTDILFNVDNDIFGEAGPNNVQKGVTFTSRYGLRVEGTKTEPVYETLTVTGNGTYVPTSGIDGYDKVVVNIPSDVPYVPVTETLTATENGTYTPNTGVDGYSKVTVNVPEPKLESLDVTENGTYTPNTGVDGYSKVIVKLPEPVYETWTFTLEDGSTTTKQVEVSK